MAYFLTKGVSSQGKVYISVLTKHRLQRPLNRTVSLFTNAEEINDSVEDMDREVVLFTNA